MPKYFTVVYEITDENQFAPIVEGLKTAQVMQNNWGGVAKIAACGWGDYATERDAYHKEIVMDGKAPHSVLTGYIMDEHPDRLTWEQAEAKANEVAPE